MPYLSSVLKKDGYLTHMFSPQGSNILVIQQTGEILVNKTSPTITIGQNNTEVLLNKTSPNLKMEHQTIEVLVTLP